MSIPALGVGVQKAVDVVAKPSEMAYDALTGKTVSSYGIPSNLTQVGWWSAYTDKDKTYAAPEPGGQLGNANIAVFVAHTALDDQHGVFAHLGELKVGQIIYLSGIDVQHHQVKQTWVMIAKALSAEKADINALNNAINAAPAATGAAFITCSGPINSALGHHEFNTVVFAKLLSVSVA